MCGLAGIFNMRGGSTPTQNSLESMISRLEHRGPDEFGYYHDSRIGLAHSRLSIIDLKGGHQPIHNEDKSVYVVFNGEIFNYLELRKSLIKKGHKFYTDSDTEVIVHAYEEYGEAFVHQLNGQFAIALWDKGCGKLLLIRDRVGIHPLFYTVIGNQLVFGSEIKAILPLLPNSPKLNTKALDQIFTFWSPISPNTIFENIFEVSPGNLITVENEKISNNTYWDFSFPTEQRYHSASIEEQSEELTELLIDATKLRLRSDVPVGAYLSGGLDSSIITSMIHHYGEVPLRTFSIGFEDNQFDERCYQRQMIDYLNADHSHIVCKNSDIADNFAQTIWHTESPILRTAPVPMRMLSGLVHEKGYKVVLTGEGADEVFGGYDLFKEGKIRQFWAKNPSSQMRPLLLKKLYPYLDISKSTGRAYLEAFFGVGLEQPELPWFSHLTRWATAAKCKEFFSQEMKSSLRDDAVTSLASTLPNDISKWASFNQAQYIESKLLMAGYLLCSQGDRMLMANSVEGRFPFLDHRVIEFANRLDPRLKMKVLNEKYLLKRSMSKYLPKDIVARYKQPYRAPDIPAFFGNKVPDYVEDLLSENVIRKYGYFDAKKVFRLKEKIKRGRAIGYKDNMALVGILSTQMWHNTFIDNFNKNYEHSSG